MIMARSGIIFAGYRKGEKNPVYPGRHYWHLILHDIESKVEIMIKNLTDIDYMIDVLNSLARAMEKEL